jgi:Tat protein secretion system quality control protein TatD with DNase activity
MADGTNHPANLPAIARGLASALQVDAASLARDCLDNTRQFFDSSKRHFPP